MTPDQELPNRSGRAWAALLIGGSCLYASLPTVAPWLATRDYQPTAGVVVRSDLVRRQASGMSRVRYFPAVSYRYAVAGKPFTSAVLGDNSQYGRDDSTEAASIAARYPVGAAVTVYHDPSDPSQATLRPTRLSPFQIVLLLIGALAALTGLGLLLVRRRAD